MKNPKIILIVTALALILGSREINAIARPSETKTFQVFQYQINLEIPKQTTWLIPPFSYWARNKVILVIPPDWPGNEVFIDSTSSKPAALEFGPSWATNMYLHFFTPVNSDQKISVTGYVKITPLSLNNNQTISENYYKATVDDLKSKNLHLYLGSSEKIESDNPEIVKVAQELKGNKTKISEIISATYAYVVSKIDYNYLTFDLIENGQFIEPQSALETLRKGSGICGDYSRLLIALFRAQGIPARMVTGAVDIPLTGEKYAAFHAWVQVYVPNTGFIDIDPTWGEDGVDYISENDFRHIRLGFALPDNSGPFPETSDYFDAFGVPTGASVSNYSMKFSKVDDLPQSDRENIYALTDVFISSDGPVNHDKNYYKYAMKNIFTNPAFLFVAQSILFIVFIKIAIVAIKTKKIKQKR